MSNTVKQIPGRCNLIARVGDDLSFQFVAKQSGTPINMSSGYTFSAGVVTYENNTVDFAVDTSGFSAGTITITMVDTTSATIPVGSHHWYLDRVDSNLKRRWLAGDFYAISYKE